MSFTSEYPEQRYVLPHATLRREVLLPNGVYGTLLVRDGQRVEVNTILARGQLPSHHHIVEAARALGLKNPDDLNAMLVVEMGDVVVRGDVLAGRHPNRGARAFAPVEGVVVGVDRGRIIVREAPEEVDLLAGMQGFVVELRPRRGAVIQATGAVLQGVWGNNQRAVGAIRMEPSDGLEFIQGNDLSVDWRSAIVITRNGLGPTALAVMEEQDIAGVIAPSMDSTLIDAALSFNRAILLTEGFGNQRMSITVQSFLQQLLNEHLNVRGSLDAVLPNLLESRRPELLVNIPVRSGEDDPRAPRSADRLRAGMQVRVTVPPYQGQTVTIEEIPRNPIQIDGGMRMRIAHVQLPGGDSATVPIANLEVFAG
jgi:hypothetical protein